MENYNLPHPRKLRLANRIDSPLPKSSTAGAQFRYATTAAVGCVSRNHLFRASSLFLFTPDRFWRSDFAFPFSFLGAGSLRIGARPCGDVACRRFEKIRTVWVAPPNDSVAS